MSLSRHRRAFLAAGLTSAAVLCGAAPAALANMTPQTPPFTQDWTNAGLITANDDWSGVPGIVGFRGDGLTATTGTDPQTIVASDTPGVVDVNANQTNPSTLSTGGVSEFAVANPTVGLTGSGTAQAPYLKFYLDTTGQTAITVAYNLRDIDGSSDNAAQPVALQYRVGSTGTFTNIPAGNVPDATTGPNLATLVTPVSAVLPAAANDKPLVEVRVITTNAVGNDEYVGVDDISVTGTVPPPADDCTIVGTDAGETLNGTAGADVICGRGGNDTIYGVGGNDVIRGEGGDDLLRGGAGNDSLDGGEGTDRLDGELGADVLAGGANPADRFFERGDLISGGDVVEYRNRRGAIRVDLSSTATGQDGGAGEGDTVGSDVENVVSGAGNDTLIGDGVRNVLNGDAGSDTIRGGDGDDFLYGRAGNDTIDGEVGADSVNGQEGNDTLTGGVGTDALDGFTGNDTLSDADGAVETRFDCGADLDTFAADGNDPVVNCEAPAVAAV